MSLDSGIYSAVSQLQRRHKGTWIKTVDVIVLWQGMNDKTWQTGGRRVLEVFWSVWSSRLRRPVRRWCLDTYNRWSNIFLTTKKGKKWTKWPLSLFQGVAERGVSVVATKNIIDAVKVNFETSSKTLSLSENVYNSICFRQFGFQRIEIWKKQKRTLRSLSLMCKKNVCRQFTVLKHNKTCPEHTWYLSVLVHHRAI